MFALACLYHEHAHLCDQLEYDDFHLGKRHHKQSEALLVFPDTHFVYDFDRTVMDSLIVNMVNVELEYVETALGVVLGSLPEVGVNVFGWPAYHGDCEAYNRDLMANHVDFLVYSVMHGTLKALPVALGTVPEEPVAESLRARRASFEEQEEQVICVLERDSFAPQPPY